MNWLAQLSPVDYVILGILVGALAIGWARGLVGVLTGLIVFVVTIMMAGRYVETAVDWINRQFGALAGLKDLITRRLSLPAEAYHVPANSIPFHRAMEWLESVPLPPSYRAMLARQVAEWSDTAGGLTTAEFIVQTLANALLHAAAFFAVAVVIGGILALFAQSLSRQIKEIPLVGTANRLLGAVVTGGQAALVMALIVGILVPLLSIYGMPGLGDTLDQAQLTPHLLDLFERLRDFVFGDAAKAFLGGGTE